MMMQRPDRDALLDRHIDGALSEADRAALRREMEADPEFAAEVALHESIVGGLRKALPPREVVLPPEAQALIRASTTTGPAAATRTPPPAHDAPAPIRLADRRPAAKKAPRWFAIAALLAITAVGIWGMWINFGPQKLPEVLVSAARVYEVQKGAGFKPEWVCTTEKEFAQAVRDRLGQALVVAATPAVELIGWAYPPEGYTGREIALSRKTMTLLARVDGAPVIVIIDRAERDRDLSGGDPTLRLFKRTVGDLVLYEVTPREAPGLLDRFFDPDKAPAR